jgi:hypothetical protein
VREDDVGERPSLGLQRRIEPVRGTLQAQPYNHVIERLDRREKVSEAQPVCGRNERRTSVKAQTAGSCHIKPSRILAVTKAAGPDRLKRTWHQACLAERQSEVAKITLHHARPFGRPIGVAGILRSQTLDFDGDRRR